MRVPRPCGATGVAYLGVGGGAAARPVALGLEQRFKAAVFWSGGFPIGQRLPEVDAINFAPQVTTPVLLLNGKDDFTFPIEASQLPMLRFLGDRKSTRLTSRP